MIKINEKTYLRRELSYGRIIAEAEVHDGQDIDRLYAVINKIAELRKDKNVRNVTLNADEEMYITYYSPMTEEEIERKREAKHWCEKMDMSRLCELIDKYPEFALTYIKNYEDKYDK